jgi:hypothetical protein
MLIGKSPTDSSCILFEPPPSPPFSPGKIAKSHVSLFKGSIARHKKIPDPGAISQRKAKAKKIEDRRSHKNLWESKLESRVRYTDIKKQEKKEREMAMCRVPSSRRPGEAVCHFVQEL